MSAGTIQQVLPAVQRDAARCVANRNAKALSASFDLRVADGKRAAARVRSAASAPASAWLMATPGATTRLGDNTFVELGEVAAARGSISTAAFVKSAFREVSCALQRGLGLQYGRALFNVARASGRQFMPGLDTPVQEEGLV